MSRLQISHSPDLQRLRDDGYDIGELAGYLLVRDVPYVNASREVKRGILVCELKMAGEMTAPPDSHVMMFAGEFPCDARGTELDAIRNSGGKEIGGGFSVNWTFSSKPVGGRQYTDYHEKVSTYVAILESQAQAIEPGVSARTFPAIEASEEESVFKYLETASTRAGITECSQKLELRKLAIVGLGGTGSYVLDLVAKTWVQEIHLYDGDRFYSHNAFRAPGAASITDLNNRPNKAAYFAELYSRMRRGLVVHDQFVDATNLSELSGMDFVFLCLDPGDAKLAIVTSLEESGTPFIDVGMGVDLTDASLSGIVRVTTSLPGRRDHFRLRAPLTAIPAGDYPQNIQIADLNAINAALAVIKWKKLCGFYRDDRRELNSTFTVDANMLLSDEIVEA
jgi:hypothetical protein